MAANQRRYGRGLKNVRNQRSGSRLAVRPRDRNKFSAQKTTSEFNLAPHRNAAGAREFKLSKLCRNAGADNNQISIREAVGIVSAKLDLYTRRAQLRGSFCQFCFLTLLGGSSNCSIPRAKKRG